jgi:hypothetical protein
LRAHFVPIAYLKAFSDNPSKGRDGQVNVITREREFTAKIDKLCACTDYYTKCPKTDFKLFENQEKTFADLSNANDVPYGLSNHIWQLKLRNTAILDSTKYRQLIATSATATPLGERYESFISTNGAYELITCDDPVITYDGNTPQEMCFLLTISPSRLFVSAPKNRYLITSATATEADVLHINRLVCRQVRNYAITHPNTVNLSELKKEFPQEPISAMSDILHSPYSGDTIILNFRGHNSRGPESLPSFMNLL